jgi:hypothetical protein
MNRQLSKLIILVAFISNVPVASSFMHTSYASNGAFIKYMPRLTRMVDEKTDTAAEVTGASNPVKVVESASGNYYDDEVRTLQAICFDGEMRRGTVVMRSSFCFIDSLSNSFELMHSR